MQRDSFTYTQFRLSEDRTVAFFEYALVHGGQQYHLTETLAFPMPLLNTSEQLRSLRALHLALGVSYYKIFVPPTVTHPYAMDEAEAAFWNTVWENGLGEFLYVNKLPAERLAKFAAQDGLRYDDATETHRANNPPEASDSTATTTNSGDTSTAPYAGALLGIGGGKDSIVAGELLKQLGLPLTGFVMATGEQLGQAGAVAKTMGVQLLAVQRALDTQLIELGKQPEAYHGHVPISLVFGLVGTALAIARRAAYVVVANEASASIPRISWGNKAVNHQWSKSITSERNLQQLVQRAIAPEVTYFSAIRQLTSIGVAKLFAQYPQYFEVFTSDNFVFRVDPLRRPSGRWGLESPKSLSSYILLAPWLSDEDVKRIFTFSFLNESNLSQLFLELTGVEGEPPLDCVGTVEELTLSVNLLAQAGRYTNTALMQLARERGVIRENNWQQELQESLRLQPNSALPPLLHNAITDCLQGRLAQ